MTAFRAGRWGFWIKPPIAIALIALADTFFFGGHVGSTVGVFALTQDGQATGVSPTIYMQLAISKEGIISGNMNNTVLVDNRV